MKNIVLFLSCIVIPILGFSQNPRLSNALISPAPMIENGTGTMSFTYVTGNSNIPLNQALRIIVGFGGVSPVGPPTGAGADLFNWQVDPFSGGYIGTQKAELIVNGGGIIEFSVNVIGPVGGTAGFSANLGNVAGLTGNNVNDDTAGTDTTIDAAAPVDLMSFDVTRSDCEQVKLTWVTANELNNAGFEVQRSLDGTRFETIGVVPASSEVDNQGNTHYAYLDQGMNVKDGWVYYRLKQNDFDGAFEIFQVEGTLMNCNEDGSITIFPNPAKEDLNFLLPAEYLEEDLEVRVFSESGRLVRQMKLNNIGHVNQTLPVDELTGGLYTIKFISRNKTEVKTFLKVR